LGCLIALIGLFSPRLALFLVWLFSDLLSRAFDGALVPLLGFFLLPWTTLVYALVYSSSDRVEGFEWFLVAIAFLIDLGAYSGGERFRRRR
jgi:CDP-diglyceride synthetase